MDAEREDLEDLPLLHVDLKGEGKPAQEPHREQAGRERESLRLYLKEMRRIPLLGREEEADLAQRVARGDPDAEKRMVEANLRLVVKIARRYLNRGLPLSDLIEEGNIGLLRAVRKYRPDRGSRFSTYATWWIRQAIARVLSNQARLIRLPVHVEHLMGKISRARTQLTQQHGRPPTLDELERATEVPAGQILELETVAKPPLPLESQKSHDAGWKDEIGSFIKDRSEYLELLDQLSPNERQVLVWRFGVGGEKPMTLEAIGQRLKLTRERIRQIEAKGLRKLRTLLLTRGVTSGDLG